MRPERCIIPDNPPYWRDYNAVKDCREMYHRHEVFPGYNRQHCIEDGLVIFLTPQQHNMGTHCIHNDTEYRRMAQEAGQRAYESRIGTHEDFMRRYGKNYL